MLSNAPFPLDQGLVDADFADDVDYWFVSSSMGVTKPDPAAYERVTEVLELPEADIAFVDDRPANVAGAEAAGWYLDYSKNRITDETVRLLLALADEAGLDPHFAEKFLGFIIAEVIRHHVALVDEPRVAPGPAPAAG